MSGFDVTEDVDKFIGGLSEDEPPRAKRRKLAVRAFPEPEEPPPVEDEPEAKPESKRVSRRAPEPVVDEDEDLDEDDAPSLPRELPKPSETQRSLAGMLGKYRIGEDPNFRIQLHRLLPKYLPGGIQAHGYLEEFTQAITEEYIASEYGGGTYEVRVLGPDPKSPPNGVRRYDSIKVEMAGAPNPERLARSVRAKLDAASAAPVAIAPVQMAPVVQQENPGLATQALKMAGDMAERERDERRRAEDRATANVDAARAMFEPVVEAERRRADDILRAERERAASERGNLEERLREAREEYRRLEAKVEIMSASPQSSMSEELLKVLPMFKGDGEAAAAAQRAAESITKSLIEGHKAEIESLHKQHQTMLESIRASHLAEIASVRDARRAEVESERESSRARDLRHEEALKNAHEERRRDMELYKRTADERDTQWRDRMEQQELNLKMMWESRVETQKSNYESQLQWLRSEAEQLQARIRMFESQAADRGDLVKQLSSMSQLRSVAKDALGIDDSPPPAPAPAGGGGIGLSGIGDQSWPDVISSALENLPAILQVMNGGGGQQQQPPQQMQQAPQQQQPPMQPGQVVQTPQGTMVVVQTPNGLALAPKDQYDAYQAQQRASHGAPGAPRPRGLFAPSAQPGGQPRKKPSDGIPVPDMAAGLPKPRPWGEPVQPPMPDMSPQQQQAQQSPQQQQPAPARGRTSKPQPQGNMDQTKLMIANEVAKMVHTSVEGGDEPEEFAQKVLTGGYPRAIVQAIAGMTDEEVISGIKQAQPNSAGATPAGQRFVREALAALRAGVAA